MIEFRVLANYLKLFPTFLRLARHGTQRGTVFYHDLGDLHQKSVLREVFIERLCSGKRVLHFGFVDAPFSRERILEKRLIHQRIALSAKFLFGADVDESAVELYRQLTGDQQNTVCDITNPAGLEKLHQNFDVIIFGEVLEHLLEPAKALRNLRTVCAANPGCRLCVTTPNASTILGFGAALDGNELVHPDHYYYFSPVTLKKLLKDCGFRDIELWLYDGERFLHSPGITKHGVIATCVAE